MGPGPRDKGSPGGGGRSVEGEYTVGGHQHPSHIWAPGVDQGWVRYALTGQGGKGASGSLLFDLFQFFSSIQMPCAGQVSVPIPAIYP